MINKLFAPIDIKTKLSTLWIFILLNMIYADIIGYLEPGTLEAIMAGDFGFEMTPAILLVISLVQAIPIAMVLFSRILQDGINRWANIIAGVITILYVVGGGSWDQTSYMVFGTIEVVAMLSVIWSAWRWPAPVKTQVVPGFAARRR